MEVVAVEDGEALTGLTSSLLRKNWHISKVCFGGLLLWDSHIPYKMYGIFQFDEHIFQMGWFNHHLDLLRNLPQLGL